jgi:hypothetical protein
MTAATKPISTAAKPRYHSRLGIILAKELGDLALRGPALPISLAVAFLVVPAALAFAGLTSGGAWHDPLPIRSLIEDGNLRTMLPTGLWLASMCLPMWAALFPGQIDSSGALVSLLTTGVRRWEIVAGKLLAFGIVWGGFSLIQAAMLAVVPHIPGVTSLCPFLGYFHPTPGFFVELTLVLLFGGCSSYAFSSCLLLRAAARDSRFGLALFIAVELLGTYCRPLWPLLGLTPLLNVSNGLSAVFADLPYDPRVHDSARHFGAVWDHPHFWLVAVIGAIVTTVVLAALMIRALRSGVPLPNTAK